MTLEADQTDDAPAAPAWEYSVLAGTPLGEALRRHWVPVLPVDVLSRQPARRVRLLGEDLVCYRDRSGVYGLIGDRCPHRGVSLEWGNADDLGLRCPYHGWCFNAAGECVDIPLEGLITRDYVRITAHPVVERGGLLWAYLGEGDPPSADDLGVSDDPVLRHLRFTISDHNWLVHLEQAAATTAGPEPWRSAPPFSLVTGDGELGAEALLMPIDDQTTLLISAARLGTLPERAGTVAAASDLAPNQPPPSVEDEAPPAPEVELGPFAEAWVAAILDPSVGAPTTLSAVQPADLEPTELFASSASADELAGPLGDLSRTSLDGEDPPALVAALGDHPDPAVALGLLVQGHLASWLDGAGATEAAERLRSLPAGAEMLDDALKVAVGCFGSAVAETHHDPWAAAWPYAWNAQTSQKWALGRERAEAKAWAATWQRAAQALREAGTVALYVATRAGEPELATAALRACEQAVRARCWASAWGNAWADTVSEVREADREDPAAEPVGELLSTASGTLLAATLDSLAAAKG